MLLNGLITRVSGHSTAQMSQGSEDPGGGLMGLQR